MKKVIIVITSLVLLIGFVGCDNKSKSSKKESSIQNDKFLKTIEFINRKIKTVSWYQSEGPGWDIKHHYKINIKDCNLEFEEIMEVFKGGVITEEPTRTLYSVSLSLLNPNNISVSKYDTKTGEYEITLKITDENNSSIEKYFYPTKSTYHTDTIFIIIDSQQNAKKVKKAFKFLIEYCGGKDEMY